MMNDESSKGSLPAIIDFLRSDLDKLREHGVTLVLRIPSGQGSVASLLSSFEIIDDSFDGKKYLYLNGKPLE